jgi:membrane-bound lytic murein transglycosylase F
MGDSFSHPIKINTEAIPVIRLTFILILFLMMNSTAFGEDFRRYNKVIRYDNYFSKYTKHNFGPVFNWHHFKAQAIAESGLKKNAESHVGAIGLMQIMPTTYKEIIRSNRYIKGSGKDPKWNIAAGISYNRSIWNLFKADRPFQDRLDFTFGAYNAGKGNIIKAQKHAKRSGLNPDLWSSIEQTLSKVTGRHSKETLDYVTKIKSIKQILR